MARGNHWFFRMPAIKDCEERTCCYESHKVPHQKRAVSRVVTYGRDALGVCFDREVHTVEARFLVNKASQASRTEILRRQDAFCRGRRGARKSPVARMRPVKNVEI